MDEQKIVSVLDPIDQSFKWTKRILFEKFDAAKWFILGFCAFLASLGQGGGGGFGNLRGNPFLRSHGHRDPGLERMGQWIMAHLTLFIVIAAILLLLAFALGALLQWLASRGEFMFLDGVVRDRAAVVEPWHRFRRLGNSLFLFRFLLGLTTFFAVALVVGAVWMIGTADFRANQFSGGTVAALIVAGIILVPLVLAVIVVSLLAKDFVAPIMYKRDVGVVQGFGILRREVLPGHIGNFILFYLMKLIMAVAAGVLIFVGSCITCCIAALPYISSVVFLPVFVFFRAYSVYFLEQFGNDWTFFGAAGPVPEPPKVPETAVPDPGPSTLDVRQESVDTSSPVPEGAATAPPDSTEKEPPAE